jgi:serine/threonine protein kinase
MTLPCRARLRIGTVIGDFEITQLIRLASGQAEVYYVEQMSTRMSSHGKYVFKYLFSAEQAEHEWDANQVFSGSQFLCVASISAQSLGYWGFFMPFYAGGDLCDYSLLNTFNESDIRLIIFRLVHALKDIHDRGWAHRDVKLDNILIGNDLAETFLCDFGLSAQGDLFDNVVGTIHHQAPELVLNQTPYTNAVDMWAVGIVLYELFTQEDPVCSGNLNNPKVMENSASLEPSLGQMRETLSEHGATPLAIDFFSRLVRHDPVERLTAERALNHTFLWGGPIAPAELPEATPDQGEPRPPPTVTEVKEAANQTFDALNFNRHFDGSPPDQTT